ncbi:MAG: calcium-binding protein [Gemmataceae bacterium]
MVAPRRLHLENFEARNLPSSGPVLIDNGEKLLIMGTTGPDVAQVDLVNNQLEIQFNGQSFQFSSVGVKHIIFKGYAGDDSFTNNTSLTSAAFGGPGKDTLIGGSSRDVLDGGDGDDSLDGREGNDGLNGRNGHDQMDGGKGNDLLLGGIGRDNMNGGDGDDSLNGEIGNDTENGGAGKDLLLGSLGDDSLNGGPDDDKIVGGEGKDKEIGDSGDDRLFGNNGDDNLSGGQGDDSLAGGNGNDSLSGGLGSDSMNGGRGRDSGSCDSDDSPSELEDMELVANLLGSAGESGQAEFKPGVSDDENLKIEVYGLASQITLKVKVDGVLVGQLASDSEGEGEFKLLDPNLSIIAGSILTLEDSNGTVLLTGTFANGQDDHGGDDD